MNRKCYLAGPMSAIPEKNFPAFFKAAADLRAQGYIVFNPAEADIQEDGIQSATDKSSMRQHALENIGRPSRYKDFLKKDLCWILDEAEAIALLPNWEKSPGAVTEKALAECLGLEVMYL